MLVPEPTFGVKLLAVKSALKDGVTKVHTVEWKNSSPCEKQKIKKNSKSLKFSFYCLLAFEVLVLLSLHWRAVKGLHSFQDETEDWNPAWSE